MEKIIFTLASILLGTVLLAQAPQKINYQAVARNTAGEPLPNTTVNLTFEIIQVSTSGVVYSETQTETTNDFGLFSAQIGGGSTTDNFSAINWGISAHSLRITINGDVMPVTQLLSVPYALHANVASNGVDGIDGVDGVDGIDCWDTNGNGIDDPSEDVNGDSFFNGLDCQGAAGTAGTNGTDGIDGLGIQWLGTFTNAPASPNDNDAYYNSTDGVSYIWVGSSWTQIAQDGTGATFIAGNGITIVGTTISAVDISETNELQTLSLAGSTLSLSNGGGTASIDDADANAANELVTSFGINGGNLSLVDPGGTYDVPLTNITGTPNWTVSGANIYNANIGNVGIGTASPSSKLVVSQTVTGSTPMVVVNNGHASGDGALRFTAGSTHYTIGSDASAGMFKISNSSTGLGTNDRFAIDNTGRVGIGTANPSSFAQFNVENVNNEETVRFHNTNPSTTAITTGVWNRIETNAVLTTTATYGIWSGVNNQSNSTVLSSATFANYSFTNNTGTGDSYGYYYKDFSPNGTSFGVYMDDEDRNYFSGDVGIGTATPTAKLQVEGTTFLNGVTSIGGTIGLAAQFKVINTAGHNLAMLVNTSTQTGAFTIGNNNNISVGTTTTAVPKVLIQDNVTTTNTLGAFLNIQNLANTTNTLAGLRFRTGGTFATNGNYHYKGAIFFKDNASTNGEGDMIFALNNVASNANATAADAKMTIQADGDVGIGNTNPVQKLQVGTTTNDGIRIGSAKDLIDGGTNLLTISTSFAPATDNSRDLGSATLRWDDVYATSGVVNTSDRRDKTNINPLNYGLNDLLKLKPVSYQWKSNPENGMKLGLIAQDLQKVIPEVVKDWDYLIDEKTGEKTKVKNERLGVYYTDLIPVLIKSIQEQQIQIEKLKQEVKALKNK